MAKLRTLLILGRVSNLPTVWSNCLAGWLLAGGGRGSDLALLCFGGTCLYVGGMFLNDAFDAQFDQQHRPERPIPTGAIEVGEVWAWGLGLLAGGLAALAQFPFATLVLAILLTGAILVYDAVHKIFAFAPLLMALCRFLLLLLAASVGAQGFPGLAVWAALVLASYIVGLSFLARSESTLAPLSHWPCLLLAAPLMLAFIVNAGAGQMRSLVLSAVLLFWILRCLRFALWSAQRNIGRGVSGLLAAIPLVDWLAVGNGSALSGAAFLGLFGLALILQRRVPAT